MIKLLTWLIIKPITAICNFISNCQYKAEERRIRRIGKRLQQGIPSGASDILKDIDFDKIVDRHLTIADRFVMLKFRICLGISKVITKVTWRKVK